jgi:hypothetical protein
MPIFVLEESAYSGPIPEDEIITTKVMNVKQVKMLRADKTPFKDEDGKEVEQIEFSFTVEEPSSPYDGQRFWGKTSTTFTTNANCRLRAWAQEILGQELVTGYHLNTDDLIGNHCRVVVGIREYAGKDGEKKQANYAKDVIRAKTGTAFQATEEPF